MDTKFDIYVFITINIQFEENNFILFYFSDRRYYNYWYNKLCFTNGHGPSKCRYIHRWNDARSDVWGSTGSDVWKYNLSTYYLFSWYHSCRNNDGVGICNYIHRTCISIFFNYKQKSYNSSFQLINLPMSNDLRQPIPLVVQ